MNMYSSYDDQALRRRIRDILEHQIRASGGEYKRKKVKRGLAMKGAERYGGVIVGGIESHAERVRAAKKNPWIKYMKEHPGYVDEMHGGYGTKEGAKHNPYIQYLKKNHTRKGYVKEGAAFAGGEVIVESWPGAQMFGDGIEYKPPAPASGYQPGKIYYNKRGTPFVLNKKGKLVSLNRMKAAEANWEHGVYGRY